MRPPRFFLLALWLTVVVPWNSNSEINAIKPAVIVRSTQYVIGDQDVSNYGLTAGKIDILSEVVGDGFTGSSKVQMVATLTNGQGEIVSVNPGTALTLGQGQAGPLRTSVTVPDCHEGYRLQVFYYDSATGKHPVAPSEELLPQSELCRVFQYFWQDGSPNSGAYMWIPPKTKRVKGIILAIHNGVPVYVLEDARVRQVAEQFDLAEVLFEPNGSKLITPEFLFNGLCFDFTNPVSANRFDTIIKNLADISGHPELVNSPLIPTAHAAYIDIPFDIAMRDPSKCIATVPIKSDMPNKYDFYKVGGKSMSPAPEKNLENVPIFFYQGFIPETAIGNYKSKPLRPIADNGFNGLINDYRKDKDTSDGETYAPGNDLAGGINDLASGHFDMLPRDCGLIAMFIKKACERRLPDIYPANPDEKPVLKSVKLSSGWLVIQTTLTRMINQNNITLQLLIKTIKVRATRPYGF